MSFSPRLLSGLEVFPQQPPTLTDPLGDPPAKTSAEKEALLRFLLPASPLTKTAAGAGRHANESRASHVEQIKQQRHRQQSPGGSLDHAKQGSERRPAEMPRHRTQTAAGEPSTIKLRAGSWWHKPEKKLRMSNAKRGWLCAKSGAARGVRARPRMAKESFTFSNLPPLIFFSADPPILNLTRWLPSTKVVHR